MALNPLQQKWLAEYLQCFNASEAARRAGYSPNAAGQQGYQNKNHPEIKPIIDKLMDDYMMDAKEALTRLSDMARASIEDFIDINPNLNKDFFLNFNKAKESGKLHLIKKVKYNINGYPEIELHDAQAALNTIAKHHGLFKDDEQTVINNNISIEPVNYRNAIANLAPGSMEDSDPSSED